MTAIREDQLTSILAQRLPKLNGLLIYGDDQSAADGYAAKVAAMIADTSATSEMSLRLEFSQLTSDPARLLDEFHAQSLLGDRRAIVVSGVGEAALKAVQPLLASDIVGNFVVLIAGNLTKSSNLRSAVEKASRFLAMPLYEARQQDLDASFSGVMTRHGLSLEDGARTQFFDLVGNERMIVVQEAEKLALFALGKKSVSREDVTAACGAVSEMGTTELIDDVLGGNVNAIEAVSAATGPEANALPNCLPLLSYHLAQLLVLQRDCTSGKSAATSIAAARPPIHFSRRRSCELQLKLLNASTIERFQLAVENLIFASRTTPNLSTSIVGRGLLAIAHEVRSISAA